MESPRKIRMGLTLFGFAALAVANSACATGGGGTGGGDEPITLQVDNRTNRVVTVERIVASGVTVRVGVVRGGSQQTLTVPWHPSRLAHQLLWFDGLNSSSYRVEECAAEGACAETTALHLPPGAEVSLLIDRRLEVTMYYQAPSG